MDLRAPLMQARSVDLLGEVLQALRLRGTVYFEADFRSPWGMDIKGGSLANFHVVTQGQCWVRADSFGGTVELSENDLILFPHGERHALIDRRDGDALDAQEVLSEPGESVENRPVFGGDGRATTRLICGHFEYDRALSHPLLSRLPSHILLRKDQQLNAASIKAATDLTLAESGSTVPGSSAVVDRLAEVLLLQVIRAHIERLEKPEGFIAALQNPELAKALEAIHTEPSREWDIQSLARIAGMSRSAFALRFKDTIGVPPMQYLTDWRMQKARQLLCEPNHTIATVADVIGYQSEFAFAKAFKRCFGVAPGAFRTSMQKSA